jgi:hypothetical protein
MAMVGQEPGGTEFASLLRRCGPDKSPQRGKPGSAWLIWVKLLAHGRRLLSKDSIAQFLLSSEDLPSEPGNPRLYE